MSACSLEADINAVHRRSAKGHSLPRLSSGESGQVRYAAESEVSYPTGTQPE